MPKPLYDNSLIGTSGDETLDRRGYTDDWKIDGRGGNDIIYGGSGHDSLYGGRGDDLIYASTEDTVVDGGTGTDTVSFLYSATGVKAELIDDLLTKWPNTNPTVPPSLLKNIENVTGSNYDDVISGSRRAVNELDGGAGNDRLIAYGSGDFLTGGADADTFDVRPVVSVRRGTDTVTVTDFQYDDGDRIDAGPVAPAELDWMFETANGAWIGTWHQSSGGTFEIIVLGADTNPNDTNWFT